MNLGLAFSKTSFYVLQCLPRMKQGSLYYPLEIISPSLSTLGNMFGFKGQKLVEKLETIQISLLLVCMPWKIYPSWPSSQIFVSLYREQFIWCHLSFFFFITPAYQLKSGCTSSLFNLVVSHMGKLEYLLILLERGTLGLPNEEGS